MRQKKVCPHWSGPCPTLRAAMSAKKRLLIGWRWPGGLGSIRRHTRLHFSPGRSLGRRRRRRRGRRRGRGRGKGGEEEEEDLGRLCKTRPDKDCPINTRVPARTSLFQPLSLLLLLRTAATLSPAKALETFLFWDDFSQEKIGHHCQTIVSRQTSHWLRTSPPLVTSWSGPDAWTTKGEIDQPPSRSFLSSSPLAFSHPPPSFSSISAENPCLAPRSSSTARPHWLRKVEISAAIGLLASFRGIVSIVCGGLSPAIVARSRQDSSTCSPPILPAIGKFSLIKTAPVVCKCDPHQAWLVDGKV